MWLFFGGRAKFRIASKRVVNVSRGGGRQGGGRITTHICFNVDGSLTPAGLI